MTARRRRTARPAVRRYVVTPRDRVILHAVGRMGQATSDQLRRLFFGDPSTAVRRCAKLVALRLLDVHACHQSSPNIYTISGKGLVFLREGDADASEFHRSRVGQNPDLHLRWLNDLRVEFVLAARSHKDVQLESFHADLDLRRAAGTRPPSYVPDALVELTTPAGPLVLVLEIDTGTEGLSIFARKVAATVALWRSGHKCWGAPAGSWRPVVFVPTSNRARGLARAIIETGGGGFWLVAEFGRVRDVGAFGPAFATADDVAGTPRSHAIEYRGALAPFARRPW
jgi:hypothetical protein